MAFSGQVLQIDRGQSEAAFWVSLSNYIYVDAAIAATRNYPGRSSSQAETKRLTGGTMTWNNRGDSYAEVSPPPLPVRWGGTSFVAQWQAASANMTPYTANDDSRLVGRYGETYFNSLDSILASHAAAASAIAIVWYRQTWESSDTDGGWTFNIVEYARAVSLFCAYENAKVTAAAPGKPFSIFAVMPGQTDRGGLNHALMHEVVQHLAVNGRRSSRASLAGFPVLPYLRIGASASMEIACGTAYTVDTGVVAPVGSGALSDYAHQSAGSAQRTGMALAIEMARWLDPTGSRPYDRLPQVSYAFKKTGTTNVVRVAVSITAGNYLVWRGPLGTESTRTPNGGTTANPTRAHLLVHSTSIDSTSSPTLLTVTSVAVDNSDRGKGIGYVDLTLSGAVPDGAYFSIHPNQVVPAYTDESQAVSPGTKNKIGLFESRTSVPVLTAAYEDLLGTAPSYVLPVNSVTNVSILAEDPSSMGNLTATGVSDLEARMAAQCGYACLCVDGTEISAPGYSRAAITWSTSSHLANTNELAFGTFTQAGINGVGIATAASAGQIRAIKPISAQSPSNQAVTLAIGVLTGIAS